MVTGRMLATVLLGGMLLFVTGCGSSSESGEPKQTLNEKEKEQVKELQQQRQQEWGNPKKK